MIMRKNKKLLRELELENLPIMILKNMVDFSTIAKGYPIVAETAVNIDADSGYREEDFTIKHYLYNYGVDSIYLVLACRFPFKESDEYIGFAKTLYVCHMEDEKTVYVFLEILQKEEQQDSGSPYYYQLEQVKIEEDELRFYSLGQRMNSEEEQTGAFCVAWAYAQEQDDKRS